MRYFGAIVALVAVAVSGNAVQAQTTKSVPIDASKLIVKPTDTTTNIVGNAVKSVGRYAGGYIQNNAMVRTVNNLLGKRKDGPATQAGPSALPHPASYPSSSYQSPIQPALPGSYVYKSR